MSSDTTRINLYKYNGIFDNQSDRRSTKLKELKKRRYIAMDKSRNLFHHSDEMEIETETIPLENKIKRFSLQIMLPEWMVYIPEDLEENWFFKVCPKGVKTLVVARKGITKTYNKHNQIKAVFQSALPGGNGASNGRITQLDCMYSHQDKTYYILDVLTWNSKSLLNRPAEFRFYFIESKLGENLRLSEKRFKAISHQFATRKNISDAFSNVSPVDGVLFYHKYSIYTPGFTPLVGWLKPYMLPEKLDVTIQNSYLSQKPKSYTNLEDYIRKKRAGNEVTRDNDMEL